MNKHSFFKEWDLSEEELEELRAKEAWKLVDEGAKWMAEGGKLLITGITEEQYERIRQEMENDLKLRPLLDSLNQEEVSAIDHQLPTIEESEWKAILNPLTEAQISFAENEGKKEEINYLPQNKIYFHGFIKTNDYLGNIRIIYKYLRRCLIGENSILEIQNTGGTNPDSLEGFTCNYLPPKRAAEETQEWKHLQTFFFGKKYSDFNGAERVLVGAFLFNQWKLILDELYLKHRRGYTEEFYKELIEAIKNKIEPNLEHFIEIIRKAREKKLVKPS